jgi:hypothetical protein
MLATIATAVSLLLAHGAPSVLPDGALEGTLQMPSNGISTQWFEGPWTKRDPQIMYHSGGIFLKELDHGPAHYPGNAEPWQKGTVVISGHRMTHTHPFRNLGNTQLGSSVTLSTPWGRFRYKVVEPPKGHSYAKPRGYATRGSPCSAKRACGVVWQGAGWFFRWHAKGHWLVLLACAPPWDKRYRLLVFLKLVSASRPSKAGRA